MGGGVVNVGDDAATAAHNITGAVVMLGESDGVSAQLMMNIHYAAGSRSPVTSPRHHTQHPGQWAGGGEAIRTFHLSHIILQIT